MAITISEAAFEPRSFSKGPVKFQIVNMIAATGATSGTCTASRLKEIYHIIVPGLKSHTAAPTYATNVATLAFTVPAETVAARTLQSALTFTAVAGQGASGNSIAITFTAGATAGAEVVTVSGTAITIQVETGVSTADQVKTAYDLVAAAVALATVAVVGGHGSDAISAATVLPLQSGVDGGFRGNAICIGR
jgi:hypothetical protein